MHGLGSDQRHRLYLLGRRHQQERLRDFGESDFLDNAGDDPERATIRLGHIWLIVGPRHMVGSDLERWRRHHLLHGHLVAGFCHLHNSFDLMHGDRSDQRHVLHIHRRGGEQGGVGGILLDLDRSGSGDDTRHSHRCFGCIRIQRGDGVMVGAVERWGSVDHRLHSDVITGIEDL